MTICAHRCGCVRTDDGACAAVRAAAALH